MSQRALAPVPFELVYEDGEPMETVRHFLQMSLLLDVIGQAMKERGRSDYFAHGNTFVYYSHDQARAVAEDVRKDLPASHPKAAFRGPDVFFVDHVEPGPREIWVAWEEKDRLPDLIVELLSPSTERIDRGKKKNLYASVFRTRDYFLYDVMDGRLEGYRLTGDVYEPVAPDRRGRVRSSVLGLDLGHWQGVVCQAGQVMDGTWARLFHPDGRLVPTLNETEKARADAEHTLREAESARAQAAEARAEAESVRAHAAEARAEGERARADAAEAELKRLRSRLGGLPEPSID